MISDKALTTYINEAFTEHMIRNHEDKILSIMRIRQKIYPSECSDREWLDFSNYVIRRRGSHESIAFTE